MMTFNYILNKIKNPDDIKDIKASYEYANSKLSGIMRKNGDTEISHCLEVANILIDLNVDKETIICAILHSILDFNDIDEKEIVEKFSLETYKIIFSLSKINNLEMVDDSESAALYLRKVMVGLSEDVRVLFIKLADRLHNMRTFDAISTERQKKVANETLSVLVPIAHRLGINSIKSELENLCLYYLKPDVYNDILEKLNATVDSLNNYLIEMQESICDLLNENEIKFEIKGRVKSVYSIYNKLSAGKKWDDIYDILALRIFVDKESDCYAVVGLIHSKFRPIPSRFKDYIAVPKENMYQSLHTTVFGVNGNLFEIQIRTYEMDLIAEKGIASHWSYKEGGKSMQNAMEQKLQFFRSIMELTEEENKSTEFMNAVMNDVLKDSIYVYTPKGDVIELPLGSTPIDFAYRVHSKIGDQMVGAIVNDQIVPLNYKLKENDIVKINTNKNSTGPSKEWIKMAFTTHAKNKIKSFYNKIDKTEAIKNGSETLTKELRKKKVSINLFEENLDKILQEFSYNSLDDLYIGIDNNQITPTQIINFLTGSNPTKEELVLKNIRNDKNISSKCDVSIEGIDEIKVNIAGCCKPIPGDSIIGYISKGYGINIHRSCCPNVSELEERIIAAKWQDKINKKYETDILVRALKDKNILVDIVSKTVNNVATIQNINTVSEDEEYLYEITVLVENKEHLEKFMNDIKNISTVIEVERDLK